MCAVWKQDKDSDWLILCQKQGEQEVVSGGMTKYKLDTQLYDTGSEHWALTWNSAP